MVIPIVEHNLLARSNNSHFTQLAWTSYHRTKATIITEKHAYPDCSHYIQSSIIKWHSNYASNRPQYINRFILYIIHLTSHSACSCNLRNTGRNW
jgi:hypothetical protein